MTKKMSSSKPIKENPYIAWVILLVALIALLLSFDILVAFPLSEKDPVPSTEFIQTTRELCERMDIGDSMNLPRALISEELYQREDTNVLESKLEKTSAISCDITYTYEYKEEPNENIRITTNIQVTVIRANGTIEYIQ